MVNQSIEGALGGGIAADPGREAQAGLGIAGQAGGERARTRIPGLAGLRDMENADRIVTGAAGVGLAGYALMRRGPLGLVLGALGAYLLVQSVRQKRGATVESGIEVEESVTIEAPLSEVWTFVRRVETWPQFMTHVQEITPTGERRHRWRVEGPAGIPTEWESEITSETPNESLSWRAIPGSMVDTEGTLFVENDGSGGTRVNVRMLYHPPAGALGDAVAKIFRRDPKSEMRENLQALKRKIEGEAGGAAGSSRPGKTSGSGTRGTPKH
ncbi:MAG: SRPBCC family protein [Steroidobacteraceae bacterium]|jgi:uncharacterized membrane protein|nr:SRPBCC family protein [Steroidobacteraceae bacterium]